MFLQYKGRTVSEDGIYCCDTIDVKNASDKLSFNSGKMEFNSSTGHRVAASHPEPVA